MKRYRFLFVFALTIAIFTSTGLSGNLTEEFENLNQSLQTSQENLQKLTNDNFSTNRYNDTLILAEQLFSNQLEKMRNNRTYDLTMVENKLEELENIRSNAYTARDELEALKESIDQIKGTDMGPALEMYKEAEEEYKSERYENALDIISKTYDKISELQASETKLKAFYEATSRNIYQLLASNWEKIVGGIIAIVFVFILLHNRVSVYLKKRRINYLEHRKKVIKNLIAKTQEEYFEKGSIPEKTYRIRSNKYGELIRDISRQIPVLKEEISKKKKRDFKGKVRKKLEEKRKKLKKKIKSKEKIVSKLKKKFGFK